MDDSQLRAMPKAELHVHLEGSVGPETILDLCGRHGVEPPAATPDEIQAWFEFHNFDDFLERYFFVCRLLKGAEDFRAAAVDYLHAAAAQGARHVEFHLSASYHVAVAQKPWAMVIEGVLDGLAAGEAETGVSARVIPDLSPHIGADWCARVTKEILATARNEPRIVALGMGGPSDKWWVEDFGSIMKQAHDAGLPTVCHAGEHGPAKEIAHAIREFGVSRIQHGIKAVDDEDVLRVVLDHGIPCDVCPGSNVALKAVRSVGDHPLRTLWDAGVTVTLGSDDPPLLQTTLLNEYVIARDEFGFTNEELVRAARNSLEHAFADEEARRGWVAELESFAGTL